MKPLDLLKILDLRTLLSVIAFMTLSVALAYTTGLFWTVPSALWPSLGIQTPILAFFNFSIHFCLAALPGKVLHYFLVHQFDLDVPARSIGVARTLASGIALLVSGMVASAVFATIHLKADLSTIGLSWIVVAALILPLFLASDRLFETFSKLNRGMLPNQADLTRLRRVGRTAGILLIALSFACGHLHMGHRLHDNWVRSVDVPGTKLIWTGPSGELWADYYGGRYDLCRHVIWYFKPWGTPEIRRVEDTTDLFIRHSLGQLGLIDKPEKECPNATK